MLFSFAHQSLQGFINPAILIYEALSCLETNSNIKQSLTER
jgi:hypothetical protein